MRLDIVAVLLMCGTDYTPPLHNATLNTVWRALGQWYRGKAGRQHLLQARTLGRSSPFISFRWDDLRGFLQELQKSAPPEV